MEIVPQHLKIIFRRSSLTLFFFVLLFFGASKADAATLYFSPSSGSHTVGSTFPVSVYVSSTDQAMNAVSGVVNFSPDLLQVVSLSKTDSIMNLWVQEPSFSNSQGTVNIEGVVLNPGFTGSSGRVITINFRAKGSGQATVSYSGASVLANDGKGTDVLNGLGNAKFSISSGGETTSPVSTSDEGEPPVITSSTHPDQTKWYALKDARLSWKVSDDTSAVRTLIGKLPNAIPNVTYEGQLSSKEIGDLDEGVSYFSLRFKTSSGWGPVGRYKLQVDTEKPRFFDLKQITPEDKTEPNVKFKADALDETSGIDHYEFKLDANDAQNWRDDGTGIFIAKSVTPGKHLLLGKAYDKAGNYLANSVDFEVGGLEAPTITEVPSDVQEHEQFIVKGKSKYPNSEVRLDFNNGKDTISISGGTTEENGDFSSVVENNLKRASYKLSAVIIDKRGAQSYPSKAINFSVVQGILFRIGNFAVSFLTLIIPLVALIGLLIFTLWYGWNRFSRFKRKLNKEVREAETSLHKMFDLLREDMREHIKLIEHAKSKRELTSEEEKIIKQLKRDLDTAERYVNKEIKDIEDLRLR